MTDRSLGQDGRRAAWAKMNKELGKSSRRCDLAEVSGTFWNLSLVYKICNLLHILTGFAIEYTISSQTNVQLRFYDTKMTSRGGF